MDSTKLAVVVFIGGSDDAHLRQQSAREVRLRRPIHHPAELGTDERQDARRCSFADPRRRMAPVTLRDLCPELLLEWAGHVQLPRRERCLSRHQRLAGLWNRARCVS